jgi:hypothetical protein
MRSPIAGETSPEFIRIAPRPVTIRPRRARTSAPNAARRDNGVTPMVRRRIPPGVVEALERVVAALWFAAVLVLLYLTLQAQLTR